MLLVLTQSVSISYELGNGWPSCFSLLGLFECYVMSLNVKSKIFQRVFFSYSFVSCFYSSNWISGFVGWFPYQTSVYGRWYFRWSSNNWGMVRFHDFLFSRKLNDKKLRLLTHKLCVKQSSIQKFYQIANNCVQWLCQYQKVDTFLIITFYFMCQN